MSIKQPNVTRTVPEVPRGTRVRAALAAGIGNALEWYDFGIYAFVVPYISVLFFPQSAPGTAVLLALAVYGSGFVARPLGAVLFGRLGDRAGRRKALAAVIVLMALSTGAIGVLPTFAQVGVTAPILLVALRLLQGLSAGGEWGGSASFLVEYAPNGRRGLMGSWQQSSLALGSVFAGGLVSLLAANLSRDAMLSWGWRVPFLLGLVVGAVGLYLRTRIPETPEFARAVEQDRVTSRPISDAFGRRGIKATLRAFGLSVHQAVASYLILGYMPTFFVVVIGLPPQKAVTVVTLGIALLAITAPLTGWLSDRVGRKPLLLASCVALALATYPLLHWAGPSMGSALTVQFALIVGFALFSGPSPAAYVELFPASIRYTGLSVGYNFANAIFGGFAPLLAQFLVQRTGNSAAPAFYLIAAAAVTFIVVTRLRETAFKDLQ
jgi:MHS family proline/betaine transporter-like MFS transporter